MGPDPLQTGRNRKIVAAVRNVKIVDVGSKPPNNQHLNIPWLLVLFKKKSMNFTKIPIEL